MFFSFRISSTRFSHSFMGQALFPVLRNRYYIVRRIDDIVVHVSTPERPSKAHETLCNDVDNNDNDDDDDDDDDDDSDDDDNDDDDDDDDNDDDALMIICVNEWDAT